MIGLDLGAGNRETITDPMKAKRKRHDAGFKARVALEVLKGEKTSERNLLSRVGAVEEGVGHGEGLRVHSG